MEGEPPKEKQKSFIEANKEAPPSGVLVKAVEFVVHKNRALDLGAGGLSDVRFLRSNGFFEVVAVDKDPEILKAAESLGDDHVEIVVSSFEDFNFSPETFDLINTHRALPFLSESSFNEILVKIKDSLKKDGIFVGTLWGPNQAWEMEPGSEPPKILRHTREQVHELLRDMEIIEIYPDEEGKGKSTMGTPVHFHYIRFIARKF